MYGYYVYIRAPNQREREREETDTVQCAGRIMWRLMVTPVPNVVWSVCVGGAVEAWCW